MASERRQVRWLRRDAVSALLAAEHQRPYDLPSQTFALLTPPCTPTLVVPPRLRWRGGGALHEDLLEVALSKVTSNAASHFILHGSAAAGAAAPPTPLRPTGLGQISDSAQQTRR